MFCISRLLLILHTPCSHFGPQIFLKTLYFPSHQSGCHFPSDCPIFTAVEYYWSYDSRPSLYQFKISNPSLISKSTANTPRDKQSQNEHTNKSVYYSERKITESLGNVTVRGEKCGKSKRGERL
jgi:hypothetical protein